MPLFLTVAGDLGGCWGNVSDSCKKKKGKRKGGKEILIIAVQMSSPVEDPNPFSVDLEPWAALVQLNSHPSSPPN
jgi:hypothetical protein